MPRDMFADVPNETLLKLFANGDRAAAHSLTTRLTPIVMAHAYRLLGDWTEAEDVSQEAMMRLWRIAEEWRQGEAKVTTWLYRVVANLATDRLRRRKRNGPALDDIPEPTDDKLGPSEHMVEQERQAALQQALNTLPERQRQAVVLRHIEEMGNPEIAAIMEISTEAVESLTARGKRALAAALAGQREELGYGDG